jgi:hypothetical protein
MVNFFGYIIETGKLLYFFTLLLTVLIWLFARYRNKRVKSIAPNAVLSKDVLFEEVLLAGIFSVNFVYVLIPGLIFLFTDSIPPWTSLRVFKFVTVLGLLAMTYESYSRLHNNVSTK